MSRTIKVHEENYVKLMELSGNLQNFSQKRTTINDAITTLLDFYKRNGGG